MSDQEHQKLDFPAVTREHRGQPTVRIALMRERFSQAIREAMRAGADEVLYLPLDQCDLAPARP